MFCVIFLCVMPALPLCLVKDGDQLTQLHVHVYVLLVSTPRAHYVSVRYCRILHTNTDCDWLIAFLHSQYKPHGLTRNGKQTRKGKGKRKGSDKGRETETTVVAAVCHQR